MKDQQIDIYHYFYFNINDVTPFNLDSIYIPFEMKDIFFSIYLQQSPIKKLTIEEADEIRRFILENYCGSIKFIDNGFGINYYDTVKNLDGLLLCNKLIPLDLKDKFLEKYPYKLTPIGVPEYYTIETEEIEKLIKTNI